MASPADSLRPANRSLWEAPVWLWLVVGVGGALILWLTFKDLGEPLLDRHSHRQTQTAISVHYMVTEGAWFPYITPVLGPPWSIPMEFPFYQWLVAIGVRLGLPLELAGRLIGLCFWWLALFELFRALKHFVPGGLERSMLILLVAAAPASIYWSRSFMIETCALYLSVAFCRHLLAAVLEGRSAAWGWAALFGILAALQKITTLFVADCLSGIIVFSVVLRQWQDPATRPTARRNLLAYVTVNCCLLGAGLWWAGWAESVRAGNPLAREILTGEAMRLWNFGTLGQRLDPATWWHLLSNVTLGFSAKTPLAGYKIPLLLWALIAVLARKRVWQQGALVAAFMGGPLVFMSLYHVHEYYFVANGYLLLLAMGISGLAAGEDQRPWMRKAGMGFLLLIIAGQLTSYERYHSLLIAEVPDRQVVEEQFRESLNSRMTPRETLLVFGRDWDPAVAFYARRKAIIDKFNSPPQHERMLALMGGLEPEGRIGAMIVAGGQRTNHVFIRQWTDHLDLENAPQASPWGDVYFRKRPDSKLASR